MNTRTYDSNRPQEISCGLTYKKGTPQRWGERRYYALDYYLKQNFGEKTVQDFFKRRLFLSEPGRKPAAHAVVSSVAKADPAILPLLLLFLLPISLPMEKALSAPNTTDTAISPIFRHIPIPMHQPVICAGSLPKRFLIQKYAFYLSQRVRIAFHLKSLHCLPN